MAKSKLLGFLNKPFLRGIIKSIPLVGDLASNVLNETQASPSGKLDKQELVPQIIRYVLLAALMYFVFSGKLDMEEAEQAKDFITE